MKDDFCQSTDAAASIKNVEGPTYESVIHFEMKNNDIVIESACDEGDIIIMPTTMKVVKLLETSGGDSP
jgi:hypothetical protein